MQFFLLLGFFVEVVKKAGKTFLRLRNCAERPRGTGINKVFTKRKPGDNLKILPRLLLLQPSGINHTVKYIQFGARQFGAQRTVRLMMPLLPLL